MKISKALYVITALLLTITPKITTAAVFEVSKLDFGRYTGLSPVDPGKCYNEIRAIGAINNGDNKRLEAALDALLRKNATLGCEGTRKRLISVSLNSNGGSIAEAMELGRTIRTNELTTKVYKDEACSSACVLAFAAGVNKIAFGKLQIHRPYFVNLDAKLSHKQIQEMRYKIIEEMRRYATEMDFSPSLIEEMLAIPPEDMRTLTSEEVQKYRLLGDDATSEERDTANSAAFYNITSYEYRAKKAEANEKCANSGNMLAVCFQAAMLNISITEATKRIERVLAKCIPNTDRQHKCQKDILVFGK